MEQKGILVSCVGSQSGTSRTTGNPWRTDEYLLKVPGQRERKIKFEVRGVDRCEQWKNFFEGMPNRDVTPYRTFYTDRSMTPRQLRDVKSFRKFADEKIKQGNK